jgi:ABC-2 type transport system permease protein
MTALRQHLEISLRLHFRNRMALLYGYLFPVIFLIAFWVLYRYERVPLSRHMGELLTVTVLGGACFGLPTTMVSERERGVWRRYRLAPIAIGSLIASTVGARYVAIVTAGLLQLALAMAVGMPLPEHPLQLFVAFTFVTFAFVGLGLVIATLADNVPAVQALGQCIFLPMLIIGGVAVQLASLPDWALHVSAFFPGRYAVQAIQACVTGDGLPPVAFSLLALVLIGSAGALAGARLFRWDAQQRFAARSGKGWIAVAIGAWLGVGLLAEATGQVGLTSPPASAQSAQASSAVSSTPPVLRPPTPTPAEREAESAPPEPPAPKTEPAPEPPAPAPEAPPPPPPAPAETVEAPSGQPAEKTDAPAEEPAPEPATAEAASSSDEAPLPSNPGGTLCSSAPASWPLVTVASIERDLVFERGLPPDSGVVTPIASDDLLPEAEVDERLRAFGQALDGWLPGEVVDPVQRVRNYLYAAAVPDVFQMDVERWVPWYVFDRIVREVPNDELVKILYWIACTPDRGADPAVEDLRALGMPGLPDTEETRNRAAIYGVKLLGRLLGRI